MTLLEPSVSFVLNRKGIISMKVSKFGGTSLADANQIKKVINIVLSDSDRQYVVVSAPGKRNPDDRKITDLFYDWHQLSNSQSSSEEIQSAIRERYSRIIDGLGISFNLEVEMADIAQKIGFGGSSDYAASRGEYLNGKIIAKALGYQFVDPISCIFFDNNGRYHEADEKLQEILRGQKAVIPGFYGSMPNGSVKTFARGGSDITGAIVARAMGASLYENWTDVSGLLMADPRVVENPRKIDVVTYRELRELSYMGASVFHEEAMFPVQEAGIATNIRNTNVPTDPGTTIVVEGVQQKEGFVIVGVAGRKNFTVITVEKMMLNQQVGFMRRILSILETNGISFEHMPGGIDTVSIIIDDKQLEGKLDKVLHEIKEECSPDNLVAFPNMAMIAAVGRAMINTPGVSAKVFTAIAEAGINVRMINQGSSEISIFVGVENEDYEATARAVYGAFVK